MFKKVLILSAAVGAGHLRAAEALEKTFKQSNVAEEVLNYRRSRLYESAFSQTLRQSVSRYGQQNARSFGLDV